MAVNIADQVAIIAPSVMAVVGLLQQVRVPRLSLIRLVCDKALSSEERTCDEPNYYELCK
jgi:hypothetical protein